MKLKFFTSSIVIGIFLLGMTLSSHAQYSYTSGGLTPEQIVSRLEGDGVKILNAELKCASPLETTGMYQGIGELGIDTGLVLSFSKMEKIFMPYQHSWNTRAISAGVLSLDPDFGVTESYILPMLREWGMPDNVMTTYKTCAISMDVVSQRDQLHIPYVIGDTNLDTNIYLGGSHFWVGAGVEQCFLRTNVIGIFISGGAYTDTVNFAKYPQGADDIRDRKPVNRYTLMLTPDVYDVYCESEESSILWDGIPMTDYLRLNTGGSLIPDINFGGFSTPLLAEIPVTPCDTHHIVLAMHNTGLGFRTPDGDTIWGTYQFSGTGFFIGKMYSTGTDSCVLSTGVDDASGALGVSLSPNPFSETLSFHSSDIHRQYSISVGDVYGRRWWHITGTSAEIQQALQQELPMLPGQQWYLFTITEVETGRSTTVKMRKE